MLTPLVSLPNTKITGPGILNLSIDLFALLSNTAILKPLVQNDTFGQKNFGNIHGILALQYMIGSIAGPWIGSLVWNVGGYDLLIFVFFVLAIFGNVTAIFLNKKRFI